VATRPDQRQPPAATASYLRAPGDTPFRAFEIDVLRTGDGRIVVGAKLFGAFGLAETLTR
jgi:hypothetical protein